MKRFLISILSATGAGIVSKAILLTLGWKYDIYPEKWVAAMLGDIIDSGAAGWLIAGIFALLGAVTVDVVYSNQHQKKDGTPLPKPDLQACASPAIRSIIDGTDRDKFIALLQSGEITAWAKTKGYPNLRAQRKGRWQNDSLVYVDTPDGVQTTILPPDELRLRPWHNGGQLRVNEMAYDIYFNREQLKKHWPALF